MIGPLLQKKHIGKKFNKLTILDQIKHQKCVCLCDCGTIKTFQTGAVIRGNTKSCGCLRSIKRKDYHEECKQKLFASIKKTATGCWEWGKARHRQGYGHFCYKRKVELAHRISWILFNGNIPKKMCVLHKCDNPPCVNPKHLFLGSYKDNNRDCWDKKRRSHQGTNHPQCKLTRADCDKIKQLLQGTMSQEAIGRLFNVGQYIVSTIKLRKHWSSRC